MTSTETVQASQDRQDDQAQQQADPASSREEESREAAPASATPGKRYDIDIFKGWCKSCGICVAFCPRQCIGMDEEGVPFIRDAERCTGCGWCEIHCPDFAISVHPRKPPARPVQDD